MTGNYKDFIIIEKEIKKVYWKLNIITQDKEGSVRHNKNEILVQKKNDTKSQQNSNVLILLYEGIFNITNITNS